MRGSTPAKNAVWAWRLGSALRMTLACTIVGLTTLYGPLPIRNLLTYPAFAYVTTILIIPAATLGDTIRRFWYVLYAILQAIFPSMLGLWLIGPARFTTSVAAAVVAITAFFIALPRSTPLLARRIAFGQTVIVYVGTVILGPETSVVMHPVHVACSTVLGASASVLAMLLPLPRLACDQVRRTSEVYIEDALERLDLLVEAFTAQHKQDAADLMSRAKLLSRTAAKLFKIIKAARVGTLWEKPQLRWSKSKCNDPAENLRKLGLPMRGMEMALNSFASFPIDTVDVRFTEQLQKMKGKIELKFEQTKCCELFDATNTAEAETRFLDNSLWMPKITGGTRENLATFFFLYCMELLQSGTHIGQCLECVEKNTRKVENKDEKDAKRQVICRIPKVWYHPIPGNWMFAVKSSLALGFAVLFGLTFNKENGYWSGLSVAISFVTERQPIITASNARATGTAIGSVYGIIFFALFENLQDVKFLPLLPWILFTCSLRYSKFYGDSGADAAVIGALFILGRTNYGSATNFAIARLSEACIGLMCLIVMEFILQPARAATLAKTELAWCLDALRECIEDLGHQPSSRTSKSSTIPLALKVKQKKLQTHMDELENFIAEAEVEPNFWFLHFNPTCYAKFLSSLRKMDDLLLSAAHQLQILSQLFVKMGIDGQALQRQLNADLDLFQDKVCSSLECLQEVLLIKSLKELDEDLHNKGAFFDPEAGKSPDAEIFRDLGANDENLFEIETSFLQHSIKVSNMVSANESEQKVKRQIILCLNGLGFCIGSLMRETLEIENGIRELITWENPKKRIHLHEIYRKINAFAYKLDIKDK